MFPGRAFGLGKTTIIKLITGEGQRQSGAITVQRASICARLKAPEAAEAAQDAGGHLPGLSSHRQNDGV